MASLPASPPSFANGSKALQMCVRQPQIDIEQCTFPVISFLKNLNVSVEKCRWNVFVHMAPGVPAKCCARLDIQRAKTIFKKGEEKKGIYGSIPAKSAIYSLLCSLVSAELFFFCFAISHLLICYLIMLTFGVRRSFYHILTSRYPNLHQVHHFW